MDFTSSFGPLLAFEELVLASTSTLPAMPLAATKVRRNSDRSRRNGHRSRTPLAGLPQISLSSHQAIPYLPPSLPPLPRADLVALP